MQRLLIAQTGDTLAGWLHIQRNPSPLIAHWSTISRLQSLPSSRGQGIGSALMVHARQVARSEMGLEQLRLAVRGGTGLEHFYARLGSTVTGRWPGALRLAPGDDRDDIHDPHPTVTHAMARGSQQMRAFSWRGAL